MSIELNESLLVGFAPIDAEHKALVALVNGFLEMVGSGADKHRIYDAIDDLSVKFGRHFEHEKAMMAQHRYPDAANHLSDHVKLMGDLGALLLRLDEASDDDLRNVVQYVGDWFTKHVATSDRALGKFLAAEQAKAVI